MSRSLLLLFFLFKYTSCENVFVDPCSSAPCQYGGTCDKIGEEANYICACPHGRFGQHCEFAPGEIPCDGNKCENGATCRLDATEKDKYRCLCPVDYYGKYCENPKTQTPLQRCEAICGLRGKAVIDRRKKCKCECLKNMYEGDNCTVPTPCAKLPCKNGGTCILKSDGFSKCKCTPYYIGETCSKGKWCASNLCTDPDPCNRYCQNGGNCSYIPPKLRSETVLYPPNATCTCPFGYQGEHCEVKSNPCMLPDQEQYCNDMIGTDNDDAFLLCGNMTEKLEICYNGGNCQLYGQWPNQTHKCKCKPRFVGTDCKLENLCFTNNGNCTKNSTCITVSSEHGGKYGHVCLCQPGYSADDCHALDPNICASDQTLCHFGGICVACFTNSSKVSPYCRTREDFERHYVCACPIRRTGPLCDQTTLPCDVRRCKNGGTCVDMNETEYECQCMEGYGGYHCEIIDDMCTARSPCLNGGTCTKMDSVYGYRCDCQSSFHGIACQKKHYEIFGYVLTFYQYLAIWAFVGGAIATIVFAVMYWLCMFCIIKTKEKEL